MSALLHLMQSTRPVLIMIGAVVTGKEVKGIERATREFRRALDSSS